MQLTETKQPFQEIFSLKYIMNESCFIKVYFIAVNVRKL